MFGIHNSKEQGIQHLCRGDEKNGSNNQVQLGIEE
jgi:hypothetical protein